MINKLGWSFATLLNRGGWSCKPKNTSQYNNLTTK